MEEKEKPALDIHDQTRFPEIITEIKLRAGQILIHIKEGRRANFLESPPTEWIMAAMMALKRMSRHIDDYRELREGFINICAVCLLCINFADQVYIDHISGGKN